VVDRPFAPLLRGLADGLDVLPWPPVSGGTLGWIRELRTRRYDLVVDYLGSPRTAWWTVLSGAPLRVGYDLPLRRFAYNVPVPRNRDGGTRLRQFAGEAFLDPLRAIGLQPPPWSAAGASRREAEEGLGAEYRAWLPSWRDRPEPRVVLVLSASWPAKAWPADHGARLMRQLDAAGARALLVPGPDDAALATAVRAAYPGAEIAPSTTLLELADLLGHAQAFVGTDNGARHLARLVGTATATLFGPTDPVGWNPADPRHVSVRTGEPCSPCDLTECPIAGHPCLTGLAPELAFAAVRRLLGREGYPLPQRAGSEAGGRST
jgi:ADP-heptose:LPS heptosyltransferase